jgi:hypothetical protein
MAVSLALIGGAGWQFFDDSGLPLSGGKIYTYAAGTTTPLTTYTSRDGLTANANPIILDAAGRTPQQIWSTEGLLYKYVVAKSNDVQIRVWDNIGGSVVASNLGADLANTADNSKGDALIGFRQSNSAGFLTGATARTVNDKLQEFISVKDFGAVGTGATDDAAAIQAAIDSISATGGDVYFPAGTYLVNTAIRAKANTTLYGDGYASKIMCPADGWLLSSTDIYGIITVKNADNVKITGLYIYGTKTQAIGQTPKLIYYENAENLTVSYNYLENTAFEGIWSGGSGLDSTRFSITNNRIDNVGWPAGAYLALPAIQTNGLDGIIANNILNNVGTGIGASGAFTIVANNLITGIRLDGIGTGDNGEAAVGSGITTIIGNVIEYTADPAINAVYYAIKIGGSAGLNRQTNCTGNTIKIVGLAGATSGRGIYIGTAENVIVSNNTIEIDARGYGINIDNSAVDRTVFISNNAIKFNSEIAPSFGVIATCAAAYTLNIVSSNNFVS